VACSTGTASADEDEGVKGGVSGHTRTAGSTDVVSPTRHKGNDVVAVTDTTTHPVNGEKSQSPDSLETKKSDSDSEADEPIHPSLPTRERADRRSSTSSPTSAETMSLLLVDDNV